MGPDHFDVAAFGAKYAYTVDGGAAGSIEFENFNAASAVVDIAGVSVHRKGKSAARITRPSLGRTISPPP